jgi:hypothetical protein
MVRGVIFSFKAARPLWYLLLIDQPSNFTQWILYLGGWDRLTILRISWVTPARFCKQLLVWKYQEISGLKLFNQLWFQRITVISVMYQGVKTF